MSAVRKVSRRELAQMVAGLGAASAARAVPLAARAPAPFDFAQDRPFDFAQGRPFGLAQGRREDKTIAGSQ